MTANYPIHVYAPNGDGTVDGGTSSLSGTFEVFKTFNTSATGTAVIAVRTTSSATTLTTKTVQVKVAGGSTGNAADGTIGTFSVTTRDADYTPDSWSPNDSGGSLNTQYTTNTYTVTGLEPNTTFTVRENFTAAGLETGGLIDAGTTALSGTFETSKSVTTTGSGTFIYRLRTRAGGTPYNSDALRLGLRISTALNDYGFPRDYINMPHSTSQISGINLLGVNTTPLVQTQVAPSSTVVYGIQFNNCPAVEWALSASVYSVPGGQVSVDNSTWSTAMIFPTTTAGGSLTVYFRFTAPSNNNGTLQPAFYVSNYKRQSSFVLYADVVSVA